ncbi:hypothetical protein [Sorangium sp. So ce406]|uniref:hypothetical protein n=1 Tax=Sorangium sp. So ce406 TaxID=3133311 RepID=UPI003F5C8F95
MKAAVDRLGLSAEAGRQRRWTDLNGQKLGVTQAKSADVARYPASILRYPPLPALRFSSSAQLFIERSATGSPSP